MASEEKASFPEIPGYKIEKKIGRGGMADVYLGVQETLNRQVAIKILNPGMIQNEQLLQRFINEAQTASRLEHPNIVTIHNVGQIDKHCYIVMEFLQESLVDRIRCSPNLKIENREAFRIVRKVAKALQYAHKEGFIHRDIKPDNILFRKDNSPVLVDFGIARQVDSDSRLTTMGMIIGTPHYMSPEQCRGEKIDGQSDIYSLGAVFYEMLTGDIPFQADSAAAILVKHIQDPIPKLPPSQKRYQPLLERMMAKNKRDRVKSADELLELMDHFVTDSTLDSIEVSQPDRYVFDGPTHTADTSYRRPDLQPTILSSQTQPQIRRSIIPWLLLIVLLGGGGYFGYKQFIEPTLKVTLPPGTETQQNEIIDVDDSLPGLPKTGNDKSKNTNTATKPKTTSGKTPKESGNNQPTSQPITSQPVSPKKQPADLSPQEKNYLMFLGMAQEYFKDGDMQKAKEKLSQAREIKSTSETEALQKQITNFQANIQDEQFRKYLSAAMTDLKKGRITSAKKNLTLAKKIKTTSGLQQISRQIASKERSIKAATQRKRKDDEAYKTAQATNTIIAYEKYLKRYPRGRHAAEAKQKLDQTRSATTLELKIKDDVTFETASSTNKIVAYEKYLKEFPFGAHAKEARKKIEALKVQLVKATKVKIQVQQIRFFESGAKAQPRAQRKYMTRFAKASTRYIYTELTFRNILYRIADSNNRVVIQYSGPFTQQLKGVISVSREGEDGAYSRGMGWKETGKWAPGKYTISVTIEGKAAGNASFEVN
jgi:serine/threonine protein kinase